MVLAADDLTIEEQESPAPPGAAPSTPEQQPARKGDDLAPGGAASADEPPLPIARIAGAAALSAGAAAWVVGGLISGIAPRLCALLGVAIGVAIVALSHRVSRPGAVQWSVFPVAALAGAILIAPVAEGGTANLPGLVAEALASGGLLQPPIPFDPGWRFILVFVLAVVAASATSAPLALRRPKLAVLVPLPLTVGGALLQPPGSEVATGMAAVAAVIASIGLAYGAQLADGQASGSFELRRALRGGAMLVAIAVVMAILARADILFPATDQDRVIPPQKPPSAPLEKDRILFHVGDDAPGPWRIGVLDVYDGESWRLPPLDPERVQRVEDGAVPAEVADAETREVAFDLDDLAGRVLPAPYGTVAVGGTDASLHYDPRLQVVQLPQRIPRHFRYTVRAAPLPTAAELGAAGPPPPALVEEFGTMPVPPPNAVLSLLAEAPERTFDRIQFLRDRLYASVVAAGSGSPVDVPPARVAQLLEPDAEATPFEIIAAETLIARWAGIPARIGFGYHGGDRVDGGFEVHPRNGAMWLEAWFAGHGWVPLVGTPPRAKPSDNPEAKNDDPTVKPTDETALTIIIPVQQESFKHLFEILRYWIGVGLMAAAGAVAAWSAYPVACKAARRRRRRRWAYARGGLERVLVAYAEWRDQCFDLNLGLQSDSPLELTTLFVDDDEHDELAWLATRVLWGDLRRDVRLADVATAERLGGSLRQRLLARQTLFNRVLAATSRASLRTPFNDEIPNVWPRVEVRRRLSRARQAVRRLASGGRRRLRPVARPGGALPLIALALALLTLTGCVRQGGFGGSDVPTAYPPRIVPEPPADVFGYTFVREPKGEAEYAKAERALVTEGRVWKVAKDDAVVGTVQVALFKPNLDGRSKNVRRAIEESIGGQFVDHRVGTSWMRRRTMPEQQLFLWFPPERNVLVSMIFTRSFTEYDRVISGLLAYQRDIPLKYLTNPNAAFCEAVDEWQRVEHEFMDAVPTAQSRPKEFVKLAERRHDALMRAVARTSVGAAEAIQENIKRIAKEKRPKGDEPSVVEQYGPVLGDALNRCKVRAVMADVRPPKEED